MNDDDRIIFKTGKERPISKEEVERLNQPYEQQKTLIKRLSVWTEKAARDLEAYGYAIDSADTGKVIFSVKMPCYDEETGNHYLTLYYYPGIISEDAAPAEKSACHVSKSAHAIWKAIFQNDMCLTANLSIEFGLAVAVAHATPYEELAIIGKRRKEIPIDAGKARGKQQTDGRQPEWDKWIIERNNFQKEFPKITDKTIIAKGVKRNLNLSECIRTVKNRIFDD